MTIGVGTCPDGTSCYIADLPGHNRLKLATGAGRNADWGWSSVRAHAIPLNKYWARRFAKYSRDGYGYRGRLMEVEA